MADSCLAWTGLPPETCRSEAQWESGRRAEEPIVALATAHSERQREAEDMAFVQLLAHSHRDRWVDVRALLHGAAEREKVGARREVGVEAPAVAAMPAAVVCSCEV